MTERKNRGRAIIFIPIILLMLAVIALAFPIVLYIDGEIWRFSQMAAISLSAGAVMILIAVMRIVRVRRGRRLNGVERDETRQKDRDRRQTDG